MVPKMTCPWSELMQSSCTSCVENKTASLLGSNFENIPINSNIKCTGRTRENRICRVQNICYDTRADQLFVLKSAKNSWVGVPEIKSDQSGWDDIVDETTISNHNVYFLKLGIRPECFFENLDDRLSIRIYNDTIIPSLTSVLIEPEKIRLTVVKEPTLLMRRFFPFNVMHILHDDWIGYADLWETWSLDKKPGARLVVYDHHHANPHDFIYNWLGPKMQSIEAIMGWPNWVPDKKIRRQEFVCFKDAYIGNSKAHTWYQYGYWMPQGPLPDIPANGTKIRKICSKVLQRLNLDPWSHHNQNNILSKWFHGESINTEDGSGFGMKIAIFSRKLNRLILNEAELAQKLTSDYGLPVVFLRMEEMSLNDIVMHLRSTALAFGMHGSLLALAMFMPPGSILIEGFPFGVPAENYTPYRTLCNLPGMNITYRSWTCKNPNDSIGYPDRPPCKGGITHLGEEQKQAILQSTTIKPHLCCSDPHWLYRIYQDTRVDVDQVSALIKEAIEKAYQKITNKCDVRG